MSPLAKPDPKDEGKAQRFELFAAGLEVRQRTNVLVTLTHFLA